VRETGQRGGRSQVNSLSDANQYDKARSWLHQSPFPEVIDIHQTPNSSTDPGCPSYDARATAGLWEEGTTPITRLDGHGLVSAHLRIYWPRPTPPFPWMSRVGSCSHTTCLSCVCRAGWRRWTIGQRG